MRKFYALFPAAKAFFVLLATSFLFAQATAQTDISIGTGTGTNTSTGYPAPIADEDEGSRAQYLYRASELTGAGMAAGKIAGIKFNVTA